MICFYQWRLQVLRGEETLNYTCSGNFKLTHMYIVYILPFVQLVTFMLSPEIDL